ncbi:hypothetical protein HMPREF1868_00658 [Olsenella sp. DNF00959]|nr:hypothetical protein HMPREF1868_00658 [Olsenella sp. DNF00959]
MGFFGHNSFTRGATPRTSPTRANASGTPFARATTPGAGGPSRRLTPSPRA